MVTMVAPNKKVCQKRTSFSLKLTKKYIEIDGMKIALYKGLKIKLFRKLSSLHWRYL